MSRVCPSEDRTPTSRATCGQATEFRQSAGGKFRTRSAAQRQAIVRQVTGILKQLEEVMAEMHETFNRLALRSQNSFKAKFTEANGNENQPVNVLFEKLDKI